MRTGMFRFEYDDADNLIVCRGLHDNVDYGAIYHYYLPDEKILIINFLWVEKWARRRGVATAMMNEVINRFNPSRVVLGTQADNDVARAFYKRFGFAEVGRKRLRPIDLHLEMVRYALTEEEQHMGYWTHFKLNMKVAVKGLLLAFFHALHAFVPREWTSHHYWGVKLGKDDAC